MATCPKIQLSRLRDIGFRQWDPIGVLAKGERWKGHPAANEYDSYLVELSARLLRGIGDAEAIDYLAWAEGDHMGFPFGAAQRERAARMVRALKDYLATLPDTPDAVL